ncbi:MAG: O-antigen ligase family protein [Sphingomonas sp.]
MSSPVAALLAERRGRGDAGRPMPLGLTIALAVTLATFYASSAYETPLTTFLISAKWGPLGGLAVIAWITFRSLPRRPAMPLPVVIPLAMFVLLAAFSSIGGVDPGRSLTALAAIVGTLVCGYLVSAVVVATDSRQAFFDLIATLARVVMAVSSLFLITGISLGRGATQGLSAWTDNPNTLAAIVAPGAVIFFAGCLARERGWEYRHAPFFAISVLLILASSSRASMAWLLISMAAFWIYRRGLAINSLVAMAVAVLVLLEWQTISTYLIDTLGLSGRINVGNTPLSGREEVWRLGWDLFLQRPAFGYGIDTSTELILAEAWRLVRHQGAHFHSSYLATLVETGFAGFVALMAALTLTVVRGLGDSDRTRALPGNRWMLSALPWAMFLGASGHALFESWLIYSGNVNMLLFWTLVWLIHHQTQIAVRPVAARPPSPGTAEIALRAR